MDVKLSSSIENTKAAWKQADMSPDTGNGNGQPKRRRIGAEARHAQLIKVAEIVFVREGFERASVEQIAEEAGVTRTLVYQHFPAKRDLYMAVVDRIIPEFIRRMVPLVDLRPKHPWRLLNGFRQFFALLQEEGSAIKLLLGERPREPWIVERLDKLTDTFLEYFEREYEGYGTKAQVRIIATCYLGMIEAIARAWPADELLELDAEQMSMNLAQFLWGGIRSFDLPDEMVDSKYADEPPQKWRPDLQYLEALANRVPGRLR